jgi:hypothetical protein
MADTYEVILVGSRNPAPSAAVRLGEHRMERLG